MRPFLAPEPICLPSRKNIKWWAKNHFSRACFTRVWSETSFWPGLEAGCGGWPLSAVSIFAWCCAVVSTILNICQSAALPNTLPQHTSLCSTTLGANRALRIIGWAENQAGRVELIRGAIIPLLSHQTNQLFNHQRVLQSCRGGNTTKLRKENGITIHVLSTCCSHYYIIHCIREFGLGRSLFEMCWFYMGIAQIALTPPPFVKRANVEKKKCLWLVAKSLSFIPLEGHSNDWVKALNLSLGEKALRHQLLHSDLL